MTKLNEKSLDTSKAIVSQDKPIIINIKGETSRVLWITIITDNEEYYIHPECSENIIIVKQPISPLGLKKEKNFRRGINNVRIYKLD